MAKWMQDERNLSSPRVTRHGPVRKGVLADIVQAVRRPHTSGAVPNVEGGGLTGHPRGGGMAKWMEDERNLSTPRVTRHGPVRYRVLADIVQVYPHVHG